MIKIVSIFWSFGSFLRRFFCKRKKLDCFVVSIGNLQAGGSGKTPILMALAAALLQKKWRVGVLTRGYGGIREKKITLLYGLTSFSVQEIGDEAFLLHKTYPELYIGVGHKRADVFWALCAQYGKMDILLIDDGFGVPIVRDIDVVLLTGNTSFSFYFKHFFWELRYADWIFFTKKNASQVFPTIPFKPKEQVFFESAFFPLKKNAIAVWVVCGIADPDFFLAQVHAAGFDIQKKTILPDHAVYSDYFLNQLLVQAEQDHLLIVTTKKDAVKWPIGENNRSLVLVIDQVVTFGEKRQTIETTLFFQSLLQQVKRR